MAAEPQTPPPSSSYIDERGVVHFSRAVPAPATISPEGRAKLTNPPPSILSSGLSVAEQREKIGARQERDAKACLQIYPADVAEATIAGVPVRIVTPRELDPTKRGRVLINLHGGGFRTDTGSLLESIPIANLTRTQVIAVLYRLTPENPFPAALHDALAVYREVLATHAPQDVAIFGTSAGAILTAETAAKIREVGLPQPAALGIFSGAGDFSRSGDSAAIFTMQGLSGSPLPPGGGLSEYAGKTDLRHPVLSPIFSDLKGMPPTLFVTSTRDILLSGTVLLHQAYLRAGNDARLEVYEALPHAFWLDANLPESRMFNETVARFLDSQLGRRSKL